MRRISITVFCLVILTVILTGCAPPGRDAVIIERNQFYRCESAAAIEKQMVRLVNQARVRKRYCGDKPCTPVPSVKWNQKLARAALRHSKDMATNDFFSHKGSEGSRAKNRVNQARYSWGVLGENIFAGRETSEDVVEGWLESADHCENIMTADFTEIGAACYRNPSSTYGTYWTLVLASPLK